VKKTAWIAACLVVVGSSLSVVGAAESGRRGQIRSEARVVPPEPEFFGTVTYDTGTNAGFHPDGSSGANLNRTVGNRFNSALGGPLLMTGMVTMLTAFPASSGGLSVSIASTPTPGNTATVLAFINANLMAGAFNAIPIAATVPPDFLGIFVGTFNGNNPAGLLGMSDMQNVNQGYHAIQAFYAAGAQTMIEVVPNRNAMIRATGDILVPVELMDFKIQ
jgi:hypothetical protein